MKRIFAFSILASIVLSGCQVDEPEINNVSESKTFTAVIDDNYDGAPTKTSLDEHGNVLWMKGDQVSVFDGSTVNVQYQVTDDSDGKTSASLNKVTSSGYTAGTEISNNVAYYPYSSEIGIAKNGTCYTISGITLPATQTYAQASFANGAFPMAAITGSTEDNNLGFKNVLGGLKLQLKGTAKIASISISGNADEILCGSANVTVSTTAVPEISLADASAKTVTLNCGTEGVQLNADTATPFIIALPPMTMASGFTVTVKDTDGKQMDIKTTKSQTITRSALLKMPAVEYVGTESGGDSGEIDYLKEPFTITSIGETSASFVAFNNIEEAFSITLEYKKNDGDWATYTVGDAVELTDGNTLQFRAGEGGNSTFADGLGRYYKLSISGSGNIKISGNITSLLDRSLSVDSLLSSAFSNLFYNCGRLIDAANLKFPSVVSKSCYSQMFMFCSNLTTAPEELPATALAKDCYGSMFQYCTNLTATPKLPATTLETYCYSRMFDGCTSLVTAPSLPATVLAERCYQYMFNDCTSLTTAILPANTLAEYCYDHMFSGCTSLTAAPTLPATILANGCYYSMFYGCTSLATAPTLAASILANYCYYSMFYGCTSLSTAPALPATTLTEACYQHMFFNCTNLNSAPELPSTKMVKYCYRGMFYQCSSLTEAPQLPAKSLAYYCYSNMFNGCTSLTVAPTLPATTLAESCYSNMFHGCSKIDYIKALFTTTPSFTYTSNWLSGVSSTGTFVKSKNATWNVTGTYGVPAGWTIVSE